jgi:hypothetical protein
MNVAMPITRLVVPYSSTIEADMADINATNRTTNPNPRQHVPLIQCKLKSETSLIHYFLIQMLSAHVIIKSCMGE